MHIHKEFIEALESYASVVREEEEGSFFYTNATAALLDFFDKALGEAWEAGRWSMRYGYDEEDENPYRS